MGWENPVWLSLHPLIKQFPEVLAGVSPLHISVADEGGSQMCSPGFSLAYSAPSALLFQIPAKIKAQRESWAPGHPPDHNFCTHIGCAGRRGAAACPSASHGWPCSAAQTTAWNSENALELGTAITNKRAAPAHCQCIYCSQPLCAFTVHVSLPLHLLHASCAPFKMQLGWAGL